MPTAPPRRPGVILRKTRSRASRRRQRGARHAERGWRDYNRPLLAVYDGSTVLGRTGDQTRISRAVLTLFNRRGAFDNLDDTEVDLRRILGASFRTVDIRTAGAVAIFAAAGPRTAADAERA